MYRTCSILAVVMLAASAAAQPIQGDVTAMGFPAAGTTIFRYGRWLPIQVALGVQGSDVFSGQLRAICPDLDGDRVAFTQPQVTVTPETGVRRAWCYVTANSEAELPTTIDVLDAEGRLVTRLDCPIPGPQAILADDLLVLDISRVPIKRLDLLQSSSWSPGAPNDGTSEYYRNVVVSSIAAADLPDRWWGLEAVDVVVWDRPDESEVSLAQLDALVRWVRNGGQLVVGLGAGYEAVRRRPGLAEMLPLEGPGPTVDVTRLDVFLRRMAVNPSVTAYALPISVTTAKLARDAHRVLGDYGPDGALNLISMRLVDSGRVIATGAALRDLLSVPLKTDEFFPALLDLNKLTEKYRNNQLDSMTGMLIDQRYVAPDVVREVGFTSKAALGGVTVFLFVVAYVAAATVASWWWLSRNKKAHLSWPVFAGLAVLASALSLTTVSLLRGVFNRGVQTLCVLDLESGETDARGYCLFGYASPVRRTVELSLPGDDTFLRPLSRGPRQRSEYVTPALYAATPTRATLSDVLLRATLKQAEGHWNGQLTGTVRGNLTASRRSGRIGQNSWLANELEVDLDDGYLLYIDPRQEQVGVPLRVTGLSTLYDRPAEYPTAPPACNVLVLRIPGIGAGEQRSELGRTEYAEIDRLFGTWSALTKPRRRTMPDLRTLWAEQQRWMSPSILQVATGQSLGATERGLLLASTNRLLLSCGGDDDLGRFDSAGQALSTDGLPALDLTHRLVRGEALLLAWSNTPGPVELERNGSSLRAGRGLTFFRVRIPLSYTGSPPSVGGSLP